MLLIMWPARILRVLVVLVASFSFGQYRPLQLVASSSSLVAPADVKDISYDSGFVLNTILDERKANLSIYTTLPIPGADFIYVLDASASNLFQIRLPVKKDVDVSWFAGSNAGESGHKDGWGKNSLFNHPKDMTVDPEGNIYVADVRNSVIRKISSEGVVSTIAGQSNSSGYVDGEGKKARLSTDFDVKYLPSFCSLLVADRGNKRLRMIELKKPEDCTGISKRTFSVDIQGLVFVIFLTATVTASAVLVISSENVRAQIAALPQLIVNRLSWRRSDELYMPLQNSTSPRLPYSGEQNHHGQQNSTAGVSDGLPSLIDFSDNTAESSIPPLTDRPHYDRGSVSADGNSNPTQPSQSSALFLSQGSTSSADSSAVSVVEHVPP